MQEGEFMRNWKTAGVRNLQKGLVWLLAAILLITMLPLAGLAAGHLAGTAAGPQNPANGPAFWSSFTVHAASYPTSGECGSVGDNVKWKYNTRSGELTISGSGPMYSWQDPEDEASEEFAPWIYYYEDIKKVTIQSGVTTVGAYAFAECLALTSVSIPDTVTHIGNGSFQDCLVLHSVTLPNSVGTIGQYAFNCCLSLKTILIPSSVKIMGDAPFGGCISLESIKVAAGNPSFKDIDGVLFSKDGTFIVCYPGGKKDHIYSIPNGVEDMCSYAFSFNEYIRAVIMPDSLTCIPEGAFLGDENVLRIFLSKGVKWIGEGAFAECSKLADVYFRGTEADRGRLNIYEENDPLYDAEWHYNASTEDFRTALFEDVPKDAYFYDPVNWAARTCVTTGTSDITFSPNDTCTRGQAVTFLWRAHGSEKAADTQNPFTDVKESDYYYDAVLWAVKNGVTNGMTATTFEPGTKCNRGQIVTFLWRADKEPESDTAVSFTDVTESAYYYKAVQWAVENGVTTGTTDTTFSPNSPCTRGQIVTFLFRAQKPFTLTFDANGGSVSPTGKQVSNGGTYGNMPVPVRSGYKFDGWYTAPDGGKIITDSMMVKLTDDQTLYAHWADGTYTVTFNANGGAVSPSSKQVTNKETYGTMPMPSRSGYGFDGWYSEVSGGTQITEDTTVDLTEDQTLYAHWSPLEPIADNWEEIIASVNDGTYKKKYRIGETKELDLGPEGTVEMQIAAFDADELADGSGKAAITWIAKKPLNTSHKMNPSISTNPSNPGKYLPGTGSVGGWQYSDMRAWLQSDIKPLIPSIVREAIKPVAKYSASWDCVSQNTNIYNEVTTDDLWIPSYREIGGSSTQEYETEGPSYTVLFPSDSERVRKNKDGSGEWWWLRSVTAFSNFAFMSVDPEGRIEHNDSTYVDDEEAVILGFCM